jgi:uridine monophosphate synthetase
MNFSVRAQLANAPLAKKLLELMARKHTNLCVSADVKTKAELLKLASTVGPEIAVLKTHIDIIGDFDQDLVLQLQALSTQHDFLLFEDRKFADIGNTTRLQFEGGVYRIAHWAHMVNAHILPGEGIIQGLQKADSNAGLLLLAQMSSGGYFTSDYTAEAVRLAQAYDDYVFGFICQKRLIENPGFVHMTPGVKLEAGVDALGQNYRSVEDAILRDGCDVVIVGRGIIEADDPLATTQAYRARAWDAYQKF